MWPPTPPASPFPPGTPTGQLVVHMRPPSGWGSEAMSTPVITIDGYPAATSWRQNSYSVPAGSRQITAATRYLFDYGRASTVVDVPRGHTVVLHYAGPLVTFRPGRIGTDPQPRAGALSLALIIAAVLLLIAGVIVLAVVT